MRLGRVISKVIEQSVDFVCGDNLWNFVGRFVLFCLPFVAIGMLIKVLIDNYKE